MVALNGAGITEPRTAAAQPHGGPADGMPDVCAGAPPGCAAATSTARAAAPVVVSGKTVTAGSGGYGSPGTTRPTTPASTAQIVAGLQHTPTPAELTAELAAALANIRQRPVDVRVPAASRDLVGGAALTMGVLSLVLLCAAGVGWAVRRPRAAPSPRSQGR